jgi:hypothetical protein
MKKIIALTLLMLVALAATSCFNSATTTTEEKPDAKLPQRFVVIDDDLNNYTPDFDDGASHNYVRTSKSFYVVDRYSLAVYLYVYDGGNASGVDFIPLFNKDGTILTYDGTLPE